MDKLIGENIFTCLFSQNTNMFFKKKFPPKADLQLVNNLWRILEGDHQGKPLFARVNSSVSKIMGHPLYPYRIGIAIPFLSAQENGLPNKAENARFIDIEDAIFDLIQKDNEAIVSVIITTSGMREFMIYSSTNKIDVKIKKLKSIFSHYDFQFYVSEDKKWSGYKQWAK